MMMMKNKQRNTERVHRSDGRYQTTPLQNALQNRAKLALFSTPS
jgi:hypothetical protein